MPMRWCRSQKPAKSTASAFPVVAGCHPAVLTLTRPSENGSDPEGIAESFSGNPDNYQRQTHTPRTQPQ
jgi:hypothetical protein